MADLIVVSGPHTVGKMTAAEAIKEKIGYSLMINHDSIEVSDKIFERGSDAYIIILKFGLSAIE